MIHFFILPNTDNNNEHLCFGTDKLVDDADAFLQKLDFQKVGQVQASFVAKRLAEQLQIRFITKRRVFPNKSNNDK